MLLALRLSKGDPYRLINEALCELNHDGLSLRELLDVELSIPEEIRERQGK